jgi:glycosyltransferase involved in cell wall biosynthesis
MSTNGITVVFPVKNEAAIILKSVREIVSQLDQNDELLIIDAGSNDETLMLLRDQVLNNRRIRLIEELDMYPGTARNLGAKLSANETLFFLDAGHDFADDLLKSLRESKANTQANFVFVNRLLNKTGPLWYRANALLFEPIGTRLNGIYYRHPKVSGMLTTKAEFDKVGPFLQWRSGEDREFLERISSGGFSVLNCAKCYMFAQPDRGALYSLRKKIFYSLDKQGRGIQKYQWKSLIFPSILICSFAIPIGTFARISILGTSAAFFYSSRVANRVQQIARVPKNDFSSSLRVILFAVIWLFLSDMAVSFGLVLSALKKVGINFFRKPITSPTK